MKTKGSSVVLIILIISILSVSVISINLLIRSRLASTKYSIDSKQSVYIGESYRDYGEERLKETGELSDLLPESKLFSDLDYDIDIQVDTVEDLHSIDVTCTYKDITHTSTSKVSIYNRLFFSDMSMITPYNIQEKDSERWEALRDSIYSDLGYSDKYSVHHLENNILIYEDYRYQLYSVSTVDGVDTYTYLGPLKSRVGHYINDNLRILPGNNRRGVTVLSGTFINRGNITLETNLTFDGVFISDGGTITTNGHDFKINGIFIEIGEGGSYPGIETVYNKGLVLDILPHAYWTENIETVLKKNNG